MPDTSPITLHAGLSLFEARQIANDAGMHLITNGDDVLVSPLIPPGWWIVPLKVKVTAPDRGRVTIAERAAA